MGAVSFDGGSGSYLHGSRIAMLIGFVGEEKAEK
jgi:hypothetical protein